MRWGFGLNVCFFGSEMAGEKANILEMCPLFFAKRDMLFGAGGQQEQQQCAENISQSPLDVAVPS